MAKEIVINKTIPAWLNLVLENISSKRILAMLENEGVQMSPSMFSQCTNPTKYYNKFDATELAKLENVKKRLIKELKTLVKKLENGEHK